MRNLLPGIVIALTLATATFAAGSPLVVAATPTPVAVVNAGSTQQFRATGPYGSPVVVFWTVSGTSCSGFGCGSINFWGLYTAPASVSNPFLVTITATSVSDVSSTGSVAITINPGIPQGSGGTTVSISPPGPLQLNAGAPPQPFSATVVGPANTSVIWSVGGAVCGGNCGTITQAGLYTPPSSVPRSLLATITATSQATPSAFATVTVQLIPVIGIAINPFNPQMAPGTSQQFYATVTGSAVQSVNWSVSGFGCAGASCGTISPSGFYTAPAVVASPLNVTVKAIANADSSKFATAAVVVGPIVVMSVSPSGLSLSVNAEQQYGVSITGAANTAVKWSVSGAGCSGATCGTVLAIDASTALYQAPAAIPSPANVNVTATLVSDSSKSGSATATVVPLSNNRLNGQFAFLFRGYDSFPGSYQAAGSFTADGNGNLTNGVEDINCGAGAADPICALGPVSGQTFTGAYTIDADGRGTFTINPISGPSQTFTLAMASSNTKARFIESDATGIRGSGILEMQTPSAFTNSALNTGFAFSLAGTDSSGKPIAAIGNMALFVKSLVPTISAGVLDVNDNGVLSCYPQESGCLSSFGVPYNRFSGTYSVSANGRGTAQFSIQSFNVLPSVPTVTVFNFSLYVISSGEFFLLSMDDPGGVTKNPVFSGQVLQELVPAAVAFQPGPAVFSWSGVATGVPQAAVGQVSMFDSSGNIIGLNYDLNNGGVMAWGNGQGVCSTTTKKGKNVPSGLCTYALQPNNDILLSAGSFPSSTQFRVFPTSTNTGFLLGWPSVNVGKIESQSPDFPFPFMFGSDLMVAPNAPLISGTGSLSQSGVRIAPLTGNKDESLTTMFLPNLPLNGYYGPTTLPNGRGLMYLGSPGVPTVVFWVVSPYKMVGLDVDSGAVPNLTIFEH